MADVSDEDSDELFSQSLNKLRNVFESLKETNNEIENLFQEINEFRGEIEKFKLKLKDQNIATIFEEFSPLDTVDYVDRFIAEILEEVNQLRHDMNLKMEELEIYLMDEDENIDPDDEYCIWELVSEITNIKKMISSVLNSFYKNNGVCLFIQMVVKVKEM